MSLNIPSILKNFNLLIEDTNSNKLSYAGKIEELTTPKLSMKTVSYQTGAMDIPIELEMGMEKIECNFTLADYDETVMERFGLRGEHTIVHMQMKGVLVSETGKVEGVEIDVSGTWKELDFGNWKAGEKGTLKVSVNVRSYKFTRGDTVMIHVNTDDMIRNIGGEDQMAETKKLLEIQSEGNKQD